MNGILSVALYAVALALLVFDTYLSVASHVHFAREGTIGGVLPVFLIGIMISVAVFAAANSFSPKRYPHKREWKIAASLLVIAIVSYLLGGSLMCRWYC